LEIREAQRLTWANKVAKGFNTHIEHPEDVVLVLGGIHLAAEDVGGGEQVAFELGPGQLGHRDILQEARGAMPSASISKYISVEGSRWLGTSRAK
jgi:hypothetical protein